MQFVRTIEALEYYRNKNDKHLGDLRSLFQQIVSPSLNDPGEITEVDAKNVTNLLMW